MYEAGELEIEEMARNNSDDEKSILPATPPGTHATVTRRAVRNQRTWSAETTAPPSARVIRAILHRLPCRAEAQHDRANGEVELSPCRTLSHSTSVPEKIDQVIRENSLRTDSCMGDLLELRQPRANPATE